MSKQHEHQPFWAAVACYPGVIPYHPSITATALSNKTFVTGHVPDKALFLTNVPHKFLSSKHFLYHYPGDKCMNRDYRFPLLFGLSLNVRNSVELMFDDVCGRSRYDVTALKRKYGGIPPSKVIPMVTSLHDSLNGMHPLERAMSVYSAYLGEISSPIDEASAVLGIPHDSKACSFLSSRDKMARNSFTGNGRRLNDRGSSKQVLYVDDLPFIRGKNTDRIQKRLDAKIQSIANTKWVKNLSPSKILTLSAEVRYGLKTSEFACGYSTLYDLNQFLEEKYNEATESNLNRSSVEYITGFILVKLNGEYEYVTASVAENTMPATSLFRAAWRYTGFSKYMTRTDGRPFPYYTVDRYREHMCHYKPYTYRDYINDYFADLEPSMNGWTMVGP